MISKHHQLLASIGIANVVTVTWSFVCFNMQIPAFPLVGWLLPVQPLRSSRTQVLCSCCTPIFAQSLTIALL
jgi:hypothetical protein